MARRADDYEYPIRQQLRGGHGSHREMTVDITKEFALSARSLANGRVACARDFRLFDAIGAIEIGDPKMDSGLLLPDDADRPLYDVTRELSAAELLYIFDIHMFYLMDWHRGMPLAQTLLASHYIDALLQYSTEDLDFFIAHDETWMAGLDEARAMKDPFHALVLTYFCLGIAKLCGFAMDEFKHSEAPFYEDEDISLQTMGRDFLPLISPTTLWNSGNHIQSLIRRVKQQAADKGHSQAALMSEAIGHRVSLIMALTAIMDLSQKTDRRNQNVQTVIDSIDSIMKLEEELPGQEVPGVFSALLQHRAASTLPLRPLRPYVFHEAYDHLHDLVLGCRNELQGVVAVLESDSIFVIKRFLKQLACRQTLAFPYVRAAVYSGFLAEWMKTASRQVLFDMAHFVPIEAFVRHLSRDPPRLENNDEKVMRWLGDEFAKKFYKQYLRALCSNPSRMRRLLCRSLYAIIQLEEKAPKYDQAVRQILPSALEHPVSLWCNFIRCEIMQTIVELGFELQMYLEHEIQPLYSLILGIMSTRSTMLEQAMAAMEAHGLEDDADGLAHYRLEYMDRVAHADFKMLHAVNQMHRLANEIDPRTTKLSAAVQQRRWDIRMRPLWQCGVTVLSWEDMKHQGVVFDHYPEDESHWKTQIDKKIEECIDLFVNAREAYDIVEEKKDIDLLFRAYDDEYYHEKQALAESAIRELKSIRAAWSKDEIFIIDRSKIIVRTLYGARLIYHIPGMVNNKAEDPPSVTL